MNTFLLVLTIAGGAVTAGTIGGWGLRAVRRVIRFRKEKRQKERQAIIDGISTVVRQLTQNGGENDPATLPDVAHEVRAMRAELTGMRQDLDSDRAMLTDHLKVADGDRIQLARLTGEVAKLKRAAS